MSLSRNNSPILRISALDGAESSPALPLNVGVGVPRLDDGLGVKIQRVQLKPAILFPSIP
jgi:hypothetical protein